MKLSGHWKRLGRFFSTESNGTWMCSHASVPIINNIRGNRFDMYFSTRDVDQRSYTAHSVGRFDSDGFSIDSVSPTPVIAPGALGGFDDSGAMGCWLTTAPDGSEYFYYIGWNLGVTVPFRNALGIVKKVGDEFVRLYDGPIVDRTKSEPHFCASNCVIFDEHTNRWKMWYLNCVGWQRAPETDKVEHRYHIKYAESDDGIDWQRAGIIAIDFKDEKELAISRPSVMKMNGAWHMWFSYRSIDTTYRIGYAHSLDGIQWDRDDLAAGLTRSGQGWESDMVEYPYVFECQGRLYMAYNGNGFGETGIGLAVWELNHESVSTPLISSP